MFTSCINLNDHNTNVTIFLKNLKVVHRICLLFVCYCFFLLIRLLSNAVDIFRLNVTTFKSNSNKSCLLRLIFVNNIRSYQEENLHS